jgi:hypothetical protein
MLHSLHKTCCRTRSFRTLQCTLLFQRVRTNDRGWVEFWGLIMAPKKVNLFHISTRALLLSLTINIKLFFARLYSICLFTTSVSKTVSSVYSLLTINSTVSNFWCSRTVSKVYSKLIDYYNNFYVDRS